MAVLDNWLTTSGLSGTLLYVGIFLLTAISFIRYTKRRQKTRLLDLVPGPPRKLFVGNAMDTYVNPKELFKVLTGKFCDYGKQISKIWLFTRPYIFIHKAESAEILLSSQTHLTKSEDYDPLLPWLGKGLLISTGAKWRSRRKLLTPTFHFKILEDFAEVFNMKSEVLVSKFEKHVNSGFFNIFDYVTYCTLDIILETAMGLSINVQDNPELDYIKAVHTMSYLAIAQLAKPFIKIPLLYKLFGYKRMQDDAIRVLHKLTNDAIKQRKVANANQKAHAKNPQDDDSGKKKRLAFLDLLLEKSEEDKSLTDVDIREEVDTFVFEGHDTTAAAVSFSIFMLGCHPEAQRKVHEELDSIFGDSDRHVTMDDLRQMKYLECCIKEALRIFPSVPMVFRKNYEPITLDGYTIPPGTTLAVMIFRIHRDPKHFPEPEKFLPERFFPENSAGRHPYAYIPFSAGPRNCIGQKFALMEEKVVVSSIFRKFKVESATLPSDLAVLGELIMRPEVGIDIKVFPRH